MIVARFRITRSAEIAEVDEGLQCTCNEYRATGGCAHVAATRRMMRWRIQPDAKAVQPPPRV